MPGNGSLSRFCIVVLCMVLVMVELSLFDAQSLLFSLSTMHTDWSCWSRSATKVVQKVAFLFHFGGLSTFYGKLQSYSKHSKLACTVFMEVYEGETKWAHYYCNSQYLSKVCTKIGFNWPFLGTKIHYNKNRTINNEEGFLEGVAQIWNLTVTSFIEIHGMSLLNSEGNWKLAFNLKFGYYVWWWAQ